MKKLFILVSLVVPLFPFLAVDTINDDIQSGEGVAEYGRSRITIDNLYEDWEPVPELARFSREVRPYAFNREKNGTLETLSIDTSIFWGHNGTNLKTIKAFLGSDTIAFNMTTYSPITDGLIIFMYLFKERNRGESNRYTIEVNISMKNKNGNVLLWERDNDHATTIGTVAVNTKELECAFSLEALPKSISLELLTSYSIDLTTCYFNTSKAIYEEFFFTTIYINDIPSSENL
jgi:hypothetical protein